jgi:manganese/zinc/iron transport system permease protein
MFIGAAGAGVATVVLVELVRKLGGVESGAAMGVVFSVLFALGVIMIEQVARLVDLDADCVLHGNLENITWWTAPAEPEAYLKLSTYVGVPATDGSPGVAGLPRQVPTLLVIALVTAGFVTVLFKELRLAAFDPGLSTALGFNAGILHYALMIFVAAAVVASFEAVGSILVIAMLICPAATARLLTDRLRTQILLSAVIGVASALLGYELGARMPTRLGFEHALNAAGMMTVVAGAFMTLAIFFSPSHGVIARKARHARLSVKVAREDVLGLLFRFEESGQVGTLEGVESALGARRAIGRAIARAVRLGEITQDRGRLALTDRGRGAAAGVIRSHRLWESYLVDEVGLRPDHVHDTAMRLEHLTRADADRLEPLRGRAKVDPHDRPIPDAGRD